ncbi:30S ribosomal protein S1 [candidate division KSB1 bacterium]|nr:30S ribosomal protein S1 [candidate division KSB1 bacterium]
MDELTKDQLPVEVEEAGFDEQKKTDEGGDLTNEEQTVVAEKSVDEIYKLEELEEEKEYSDEEFDELKQLYENTINEFVEGELVVGKVLSVSDKEVTIDIGFKSEGTIALDEFTNPQDLKVGEDVEVFLDNIEDVDGQLVLSRKKVDFIHAWEQIVASHDDGIIIQGRCVRRIKGGIVVDLSGVDAFLPGSQIDVKPIRDFDSYIGNTLDLKVVKVNQLRKNIVVSHRVLVEEEMKEQRQMILEQLEKGQVLEGTVKNITDFGVFIDLGGVDGLLHINDLSWGRISHPSEVVALDEVIKIMILDFNDVKDRISLGLKQLQPHPWENVTDKYPVDSVIKGKVVNISDYGAFIELEKGVEGLIHISEMSWTQHIKHPSKILAVGEWVEAKILNIDKEGKKISLGLKQLEPDPWETLGEKYPIGSKHEGKVRNLTNFGAFIELEEGIDGLIHISDLSWTKKIRHPGEVLKKSDDIEVVVLNVDRSNRRISLGFKQTMDNPWDEFEDKYKPGTVVKGEIVRLIEKGIIVELPDIVDGFVPMSHLTKPNISKPSDGYKVGDEVELCVIEFNKDAKKIVLSENIDYALGLIRQKETNGKELKIEEANNIFPEEVTLEQVEKEILPEESPVKDEKEVTSEEVPAKGEKVAAPEEVPAKDVEEVAPAAEEVSEKEEETAEVVEEKAAEDTTEEVKAETVADVSEPAVVEEKKKKTTKAAKKKESGAKDDSDAEKKTAKKAKTKNESDEGKEKADKEKKPAKPKADSKKKSSAKKKTSEKEADKEEKPKKSTKKKNEEAEADSK